MASSVTTPALSRAVSDSMPLAGQLFRELAERTADPPGVTRESYGAGERIAHDLCLSTAERLGLSSHYDDAGNLYMRMRGRTSGAPAWFVGSHLDSVLHGGNFDGAAGVIAGLTAVGAMQRLGYTPTRDIVVMATRAEECSTWFVGHHKGHLGSRAALGLLDPSELDTARHVHSGKSFAECMDEAGFSSVRFRQADVPPIIAKNDVHAYLEVHIEQGPVLEHRGLPVGVVTGIRGCLRARSAKTIGGYTHSGAVPRELRQDAVLASVEFAGEIDRVWTEMSAGGKDLVCTFGKFSTDPAHHSIVKVPGRVDFAFDFRSQDPAVLERMREIALDLAAQIGKRRNVVMDLGDISLVSPAVMDPAIEHRLCEGCDELGIPFMEIASGAGHDAADFCDAGFRSAMIFIRNANGSHNPHEGMDLGDFCEGTRLLTWLLCEDHLTRGSVEHA